MDTPVVKRLGAIVTARTGEGHYIDHETLYQEALAWLKQREELATKLEQIIFALDAGQPPSRGELLSLLVELTNRQLR